MIKKDQLEISEMNMKNLKRSMIFDHEQENFEDYGRSGTWY